MISILDSEDAVLFLSKDYSTSIQDANVWLDLAWLDSSENREVQPYVLASLHEVAASKGSRSWLTTFVAMPLEKVAA